MLMQLPSDWLQKALDDPCRAQTLKGVDGPPKFRYDHDFQTLEVIDEQGKTLRAIHVDPKDLDELRKVLDKARQDQLLKKLMELPLDKGSFST